MYQRILNKLDVGIWEKEVQGIVEDDVINRIKEQINTLDEAYGSDRGPKNMGGYVLFFKDKESYENTVDEIMEFYKLDKDLYEYSDCISEGRAGKPQWTEELYMLGSDDALVLIHPNMNEKRRGLECLISKSQSTKLKG